MEYLMYGFELDIRRYEIKEITFWLLAVCLMHMVTGNYMCKHNICREYAKLIRIGRFSQWWHWLYARVLVLDLVITLVVFAFSAAVQALVWGWPLRLIVGFPTLQAFVLFFLNLCFLSSIQMMTIHSGKGDKWAFFLMVFIEALSLYMGVEWLYTACWLPGSWKMYRRSNWYFAQGFPAAAAAVLQIAVMGACWRWGWRVFNRRK